MLQAQTRLLRLRPADESFSAKPAARNKMPAMISGADWPPVNGSVPSVPVTTVVDVTNGEVVVVVDTTTVDPATRTVVVLSGTVVVVVVVSTPAVVVDSGFVVVVVDVVRGTVVVVVSCGLVVVVTGTVVVLVAVVDVVLLVEVLLVELVLLLEDVLLLLVDDEELDDTGVFGPQNCTLETAGVLPLPTGGRPAFEKLPSNCGGAIQETKDAGPPLTITTDTARVECQAAPELDVLLSVTTCSLPAGFSNTYPWS
jgi:hypothetical protein